jgi:2-polyprenyl-3-methyl-5-hydroxy-6-metoxy-1,4-benzoquinol methylase
MQDKPFNPDAYWEDRLQKIKGLEGVGFKKLGKAFNVWAYKVRRKVFLKELKRLNLPLERLNVLDIGAGTGFYIDIWNKLKARSVTGIDLTSASVNQLKTKFPQNKFFVSDIGDKDFRSAAPLGSYDVVSCMDVLFHIIDDQRFEKAIENIAILTKEEGYFIYSDLYLRNREVMRGESQVCRTKDYLLKVFEKNGFELITFKPFLYLTNNPLDSRNPLLKAYWFLLHNSLYALPFLGNILGPVIYPIEMMLVNASSEGPTTEFTVFRKKKS